MRKTRSGFTLMELIVAVTVFSIIALSIASTLRAGIRFWAGANPIIERNQTMRAFFNAISADLKNAIRYTNTEKNFEGGPYHISFMTLEPLAGEHFTLAKVIYYLDEKMSLRKVVLTKDDGFDERFAVPKTIAMDVDPKKFGFEYCYKAVYPVGELLWKSEWKDETKVPRGVKVKLEGLTTTIFIPTGELGSEE